MNLCDQKLILTSENNQIVYNHMYKFIVFLTDNICININLIQFVNIQCNSHRNCVHTVGNYFLGCVIMYEYFPLRAPPPGDSFWKLSMSTKTKQKVKS